MATAVVSGRVDTQVNERASAYIHAAGLTTADVIKTVWNNIAKSGEIPMAQSDENAEIAAEHDPFQAFLKFCKTRPSPKAEYAWLVDATPQELKDFLAEERLKDYEKL